MSLPSVTVTGVILSLGTIAFTLPRLMHSLCKERKKKLVTSGAGVTCGPLSKSSSCIKV